MLVVETIRTDEIMRECVVKKKKEINYGETALSRVKKKQFRA